MPTLNCKRVIFYSAGDEQAFFDFARGIKGVRQLTGVGDTIQIQVAARVSTRHCGTCWDYFSGTKYLCANCANFRPPKTGTGFAIKNNFGLSRSLEIQD